jgi:hypothetical protein
MSLTKLPLFEGPQNFVKLIRFHPCSEPFAILIETFYPAVIQMAIDLYLLDETDIAFERLKTYPRYGKGVPFSRGLRHSNKKESKGKALARKVVANYQGVKHPYAKTLTTGLFYLYGPLEKIAFVMMFYSAVDRFWYNWTNLLIRRGYCELPAVTGPLTLKGNDGFQVVSTTPEPLSAPIVVQNRAAWGHTAFGCSLPPGRYQCIISMSLKPTGTTQLPAIRIRVRTTVLGIGISFEYGPYADLMPDEWTPVMFAAEVGAPEIACGLDWSVVSDIVLFGLCEIKELVITVWQNYEEISF